MNRDTEAEEIFVNRLKYHLLQITDARPDQSPSNMSRRANLGHLATASVLAILAGETPTYASWHPWRRDGLWKYKHIWQFICRNERTFKTLIPGFKTPALNYETALNNYMSDEQFAELFITWTKDVNLHYPSINVCDEATARSGFNTKPQRVLIWAVYSWMKQNSEAEKTVKELFKSMNPSNKFTQGSGYEPGK